MGGAEPVQGVDVGDEESDGVRPDVDGADANRVVQRYRRGSGPRAGNFDAATPWVDGGIGRTVA
jgi:hypothetical protein